MIFDDLILDAIAKGTCLSALALFWIIVLVRVVGLRSFSKMTNFDFVMTIAMGSLLASAATAGKWVEFLQIVSAMACLFVIQCSVAVLRQRSKTVSAYLQNSPVLLMKDGEIISDALVQTRVSEDDVMAKLREANALKLNQVHAVVLETTGDVSVLHGKEMDPKLISGLA